MGGTMTYTYLGDGTKVAARVGTSPRGVSGLAGKRYRGSFVYDVSAAGVESLESIAVSTGRLVALTGTGGTVTFESDGFITDHLGNVAAVVNLSAPASTPTDNAILEQNCYTPFGTKLQSTDLKTQAANRWRYAGKEEQNISGMDLGLLDYGARYYDPFTTRWNSVDPLAVLYCQTTPYQYCLNNPIKYVDPFGLWTMDDNGYVTAEDGDDLSSFAKYMNISPQYAYDLLFDQGIDPMNIATGMMYNTEVNNGSISPSYCSACEHENVCSWVNWLSFCMSSIENSNPFSSSDTKFRVKNSKGEFSFKAYNDTFYSNQYITKDMLHPVKPITCTLQWLGRFGNAVSFTQVYNYTKQAIYAENSETRAWAIVDAVNSGIGLIPGYGPAIVSLLGGSNNIKLYLNYSAPVFSSNPFFCPLR